MYVQTQIQLDPTKLGFKNCFSASFFSFYLFFPTIYGQMVTLKRQGRDEKKSLEKSDED
jgi:hypothetical protein